MCPDREIEGPSPANDIRANAPSSGTDGKTKVLSEDQVDGSRWMQLVDDRGQDDGRHLGPQLISPTQTGSAEVFSHAYQNITAQHVHCQPAIQIQLRQTGLCGISQNQSPAWHCSEPVLWPRRWGPGCPRGSRWSRVLLLLLL